MLLLLHKINANLHNTIMKLQKQKGGCDYEQSF